MNNEQFITIIHLDDYLSTNSLRIGQKLTLKKDHDNPYDDEAIAVYSNHGRTGYVANSVSTVCRGTGSAGFVYSLFDEETECVVRFIAAEYGFAICELSAER